MAAQTDQTQELNGVVGIGIPMMATENYYKIGVSSLRNEAGKINELQEVYGPTAIDMPMMEAMTHNKKGVPSLVNGTGKSGDKQEIQGEVVDIQKMDVGNPIKDDVIIRSVRQPKKKKVLDDRNATLYAKWWKKLMLQSIHSDLVVLKIHSIVLTFMLPSFENATNVGRHIKYLISFQ